MRRTIPLLVALVLFSPGLAEDGAATEPDPNETPAAFVNRLASRAEALEAARMAETERAKAEIPDAVAATPTLATPSGGFADRVNDSIADFLPLLQFAVNAVSTSEDDGSITVKLNPIRHGNRGVIALQATIAEPLVFDPLVDRIVDSARAAQEARLDALVGDFDDITYTLSYGYQKPTQGKDWGEIRRIWGRDYEMYRELVDELFSDVWRQVRAETRGRTAAAERRLARLEVQWTDPLLADGREVGSDSTTFAEIRSAAESDDRLEEFDYDGYVEALRESAAAFLDVERGLASFRLDELATLIDNQPQLVGTANYRDRDDLVGPDEFTASVRLEWGRRNFNKVLKRYNALKPRRHPDPNREIPDQTPASAFRLALEETEKLREDRFALALDYKKRSDLDLTYDYVESVTDPATGDQVEIGRSVALMLAESEEWSGLLQWTHSLLSQPVEIEGRVVHPKLDLAAEYVDIDEDPLRNDRFVARATYTYPISGTVSIPISLTYANKPEFLGEQNEEFSAHLGLSYKIDRPKR